MNIFERLFPAKEEQKRHPATGINLADWTPYYVNLRKYPHSSIEVFRIIEQSRLDRGSINDILLPLMAESEEEKAEYKRVFMEKFIEKIKRNQIDEVKRLYEIRPFGPHDRTDPHTLSTPMHVAAYWGRTEIATFLLSDPEFIPGQRDVTGDTPAQLAVMGRGSQALIQLLTKVECEAFIAELDEQERNETQASESKSTAIPKPPEPA